MYLYVKVVGACVPYKFKNNKRGRKEERREGVRVGAERSQDRGRE